MKKKLFIEAAALTNKNLSGVGHVVLHLVYELSRNKQFTKDHKIVLIIPLHTHKTITRWSFNEHVKIRTLPLPGKILSGLMYFNLLPWVDLYFGRGTYLFPNFRNWRLLFSPSLTYIHDIAYLRHPETVEPRNQQYLAKRVPIWIKRTDKVITVSQSAKQEIVEDYNLEESKVVVAHNGVDTNVYAPQDAEKIEQTKRNLGIRGNYIFFVGNIEPRKNLERLVGAYRLLPKALRDSHSLVIVGGDGWLNEGINDAVAHAQYDGCKIIRPNRFVKDEEVVDLYAGATCLALPSIHEGFGMPVLEALACGTRVVASDIAPIREAGGKLVEYCDPLSEESIAAALKKVLQTEKGVSFEKQAISWAAQLSWVRAAKQVLAAEKSLER